MLTAGIAISPYQLFFTVGPEPDTIFDEGQGGDNDGYVNQHGLSRKVCANTASNLISFSLLISMTYSTYSTQSS